MKPQKSSKKYIQIADLILEEIGRGTWKEGEAIPTVRALAQMFGVSPQTANKATSHLAGLGIIASRQGSGSIITGKRSLSVGPEIPMLVDKARSSYLRGENSAVGYHGKELYLNYLHEMKEEGLEPSLLIYDKQDTAVPEATRDILDSSKGVLVQGSIPECYKTYLAEKDIPYVIINRYIEKEYIGRLGSVVMDHSGLEQLAIYMASLGHSRFLYAFSNEFEMTTVYENRLSFIKDSLQKVCPLPDFSISEFFFTPGDADDAEKLAQQIESGITGIICFNDICALRIYDLLHQKGIHVPEAVSVTGFDDLFMAEMAAPPLTTVRVHRGQLIRSGLDLLKDLMTNSLPSVVSRSSKTELIMRRSCWRSRILS